MKLKKNQYKVSRFISFLLCLCIFPACVSSETVDSYSQLDGYRGLVPEELKPLLERSLIKIEPSDSEDLTLNYTREAESYNINVDSFASIEKEFCNTQKNLSFSSSTAYEILWLAQSSYLNFKNFSFDYRITQRLFDQSAQTISGHYKRILHACDESFKKGNQLFRELFTISKPSFLSKFSILSFRFLGPEVDVIWSHSPIIKKTRMITASNRSDPIASTSLSFEDLLLWSENPANYNIESFEEVFLLAPISTLEVIPRKKDSCMQSVWHAGKEPSAQEVLSVEAEAVHGRQAWLPKEVTYKARKLWKMRIRAKDPYSMYGQQILYIDSISKLPVYKTVYDPEGKTLKTQILVPVKLKGVGGFIPKLSYVYDFVNRKNSFSAFYNFQYCDDVKDGSRVSDFDPLALG